MKRTLIKHYLAHLDRLTANQRNQVITTLQPSDHATTILPQIRERERRLDLERKCLYCDSKGTRKHGKSAGLIRFRCLADGCGKTFSAVTAYPIGEVTTSCQVGGLSRMRTAA